MKLKKAMRNNGGAMEKVNRISRERMLFGDITVLSTKDCSEVIRTYIIILFFGNYLVTIFSVRTAILLQVLFPYQTKPEVLAIKKRKKKIMKTCTV